MLVKSLLVTCLLGLSSIVMGSALPEENGVEGEIQGDCDPNGRGCKLFGSGLVYSCDYGGVSTYFSSI